MQPTNCRLLMDAWSKCATILPIYVLKRRFGRYVLLVCVDSFCGADPNYQGVQLRLMEENKSLAAERSQLADLMVNLKKMQADLEHSGDNDRRRLEKRLEMIESQACVFVFWFLGLELIASTVKICAHNSHKNGILVDMLLFRKIWISKICKCVSRKRYVDGYFPLEVIKELCFQALDMSKTREALASAETSKKHLEERVEELHRQLKGNEEKLAVYERRPLAGSGSVPSTQPDTGKEEQLESEVAELRYILSYFLSYFVLTDFPDFPVLHLRLLRSIWLLQGNTLSSTNKSAKQVRLHWLISIPPWWKRKLAHLPNLLAMRFVTL